MNVRTMYATSKTAEVMKGMRRSSFGYTKDKQI